MTNISHYTCYFHGRRYEYLITIPYNSHSSTDTWISFLYPLLGFFHFHRFLFLLPHNCWSFQSLHILSFHPCMNSFYLLLPDFLHSRLTFRSQWIRLFSRPIKYTSILYKCTVKKNLRCMIPTTLILVHKIGYIYMMRTGQRQKLHSLRVRRP